MLPVSNYKFTEYVWAGCVDILDQSTAVNITTAATQAPI